ncbi:hypothetical protein FRC02_010264 [Tulasnella sp. 418]|nr:hypothetical protein FRC02_010264 [Tulasnella sp. 418]
MNPQIGLLSSSYKSMHSTQCFPNHESHIIHKSCAGTSVSEARFTIEGLENDRKFIIMDAEKKKAVTARELPQMVLIKPTIVEDTVVISFPEEKGIPSFTVPLDPPESTLADWKHLEQVMVWSDACDGYIVQAIPNQEGVAVDPSEVLSGYLDRPVHLVLKGPSPRPVKPTDTHASLSTVTRFQDGYPLLVATMESLQSVEEQVRATAKGENDWNIGGLNTDRWSNSEVTIERFRPNIVLTGASAAFAEETWKEIQISDQGADGIIDMVSRCTRCLVSALNGMILRIKLARSLLTMSHLAPQCRSKDRHSGHCSSLQSELALHSNVSGGLTPQAGYQ